MGKVSAYQVSTPLKKLPSQKELQVRVGNWVRLRFSTTEVLGRANHKRPMKPISTRMPPKVTILMPRIIPLYRLSFFNSGHLPQNWKYRNGL